MYCVVIYHLVGVIGILTSHMVHGGRQEGNIHEYCQDEPFTASCDAGHVIMMTSARYGRMNLGRCAKRSLGYLGCAVDALRFIDSRCSGHRQCDVSIMDSELRALEPCPFDVTWYLEASYDCIPVVTRSRHECHQRNSIVLRESFGYMSSELAMSTGVGSPTCPWQIVAPPGQTINITLYNFVHNSLEASHDHSSPCVNVARLAEKSATKSIPACGTGSRTEVMYISSTNKLSVSFTGITSLAPSFKGRTQFLLHYQLLGCADIPQQPGTEVIRSGNTVQIECIQTGEKWFLTCEGTRWSGVLGNCSKNTAQTWTIGSIFQSEENFPFGILLVVAVGVALGIFLGGTLLLAVSIYMKRKRRLLESRAVQHSEAHYHMQEEYYPKEHLAKLDIKDESIGLRETRGRAADDYKVTEFRPPFLDGPFPPPPPRNTHHVYESPNFT